MIHDGNNLLTDDELVNVRYFLKTSKNIHANLYNMSILVDVIVFK